MAFAIELSDEQWDLVSDLFDPPGRRGAPALIPRRDMLDAMLFLCRTGCQWRYLPERYPAWGAVWQQWLRWRANGVWQRAMARLASMVRLEHGRKARPSMVVIDAQTVKGGRYGPTYHEAGGRGGRTMGAKRSILVERIGLPVAVRVDPARPHDVVAGRALLHEALPGLPRVQAVLGDRGYRALGAAAEQHGAHVEIRAQPPGSVGFVPLAMLWRAENAFAQLGRWRRLARCFEGTTASARAWLEVACMGYLFGRLST
jgi:transposase